MNFSIVRSGFGLAAALALAAVFSEAPAQAVTTYQVDNRGGTCVASRVIHASESGMTSAQYAVTVYDSSTRVPESYYTAAIDTGNYDLSLTFSSTYFPNGYCGVIRLRGLYPSDTSNGGDFEATAYTDYIDVGIPAAYSRRSYGGHIFAADVIGEVGVYHDRDDCRGSIWVYFAPGTYQLTFAHEISADCLNWVTNGDKVTATVFGYPTGSVPIGWFGMYSTSPYVSRYTDDRPWKP